MEDHRQLQPPAPPPSKDGGQLGWGRAVPSLGSVVASAGSWLAALGGGATSGGGGGSGAGEWAAGVVERLLQSVAPGAQQQLLQQGTGAYNKADVRLLQEQCTKQQFGVGRLLRHRFHLFTSGCPELLHDLALLQCRMPAGCVGLADVASQRDFRELLEQGAMPHLGQQQQQRTGGAASDRDVVACLQFFDTIGLWLAKSLETHGAGGRRAGGSSEASSPVPTNVEGVRYFLASLEALSDRQFFAGMACTKLWYLYDLGKLLRLVTNVLYKWNDASLITVLCTAEGFPDMWALLKLTKRFSEKLQQLALPPEYAHAFQAFSILHKLTLTYPATSLSTFKFAFDLTMERMEFLNADPAHFHFSEARTRPQLLLPCRVLGSGADGLVRRMVYRGKSYAVKSIYPFYDKQTSTQPKARSTDPLLSRLSRLSPFPDRLMSARAKAREKRRAKGGADEPLIDYVGLEYMKKIEKLAGEERRDDFWRWLYAQLGEYITMLALPRPSFVKLYCAYVGSLPPPPRYYCPQCFQTKFEDTGPLCDQCSTPLTETYYGEEGLHLVLEYCAEGSLRSHLDREIVAVATAHRADETRSRQRSHEGNEAAAAEAVAAVEAAEKEEGLEAEGASQECGFWGTQLPENEVTDFLCQLLAGLAYHHARGVVHEDLKPDNILMRDRHTLCLGDFGLASFTSAKSSSSGNHGSPNYNPPELNSGQPLPADYDYTKKDVWAAGLIGLEMFGFKIPVRNVARAIDTISLSPTSLGLRRALALMLQHDPAKRGSALACLMELEAGRKSFAGPTHPQSPPAGSVNSPLPHAIDHSPEGVMEHMALVLDSYQLLDDPDQTISLMMDDKTQPLYADYTQGVEACCKFYLGLLDSSSPRMQEMCCAHLGRLASNERWRSLVIEMQAIGRLTAVIFAAATPPDLRLTIVNIFLALMQLTPQGECRAALEQLVALDVLPRLVGLVKTSRSTLLHSSVLHLLRCSFLAGLPAAYYEKTMHAELCRLLAVVGCPSLEHKAFAMQCLQHALLAYPHLVFADHLFAMMDLYHAASLALDRVKEICRMRNRDLPLPAIRIFAEGVLQLLRQSPSSSSPPPPPSSSSSSPGSSGAEAAEWLCGQLDVEGFVGDEANQRLANDVWIDLATHSVTLRRLKGVLKAILRSYELIEAFYRTAEFPVECAGCGGRIVRVLFRCEQCLSCVNLCQACHHAHAPLKDRGYWKHKRDHYRSMVAVSKQPNARVLQLLQLYPAADKPTLHPHFMEPTGVVRGHRCVRCRRRMAFSLPASHLATCTACGWTFCHACGIEWGDQDTNNGAEAEAAEDGYHSFVRSVDRISLPPLSSAEYHVMMRLLFRFSGIGPAAALTFVDEDQGAASPSPPNGAAAATTATATATAGGGGGGGGGGAGWCCHHPLFSLPHVASVPLRCSQCRVNVSSSSSSSSSGGGGGGSGGSEEGVNSLQAGALAGSCQHLLCRSCLLETCLKQIATGRLVATADSFYAITCPVGRCGGTLLSDASAIRQVVPHEFYELYLGVAALLSAKRPLSFALCKYCARKCALTWEGKLLCWTCSSPKTRRSCQEKEGWLSEKTRDGWSRRYFLAGGADGSLVCAKEPLHQMRGRGGGGTPRVVARLRHLAVRDLPNHPAHRYVFAVIVHHHPATPVELLLAADSLREKTEWMETLASWSPSADPRLGGGGGGPLA